MTGLTTRRLSTALPTAIMLAVLPSVSKAAALRAGHTATLLASGDLLIAGGVDETGAALASADLFTAARGPAVVATDGMSVARASHTATLMANGCVLVAGGNTANDTTDPPARTATAEIYDPSTNQWTSAGSLGTPRYNHTATLLNNGKVLICGGQNNAGGALASCEFYTPTSCTAGSFSAAPSLLQARYNHTAVLLKNGMVWFAGGSNPAITPTSGYLPTTEKYDPGSNAFQSASPLIEARAYHTATLMGDGKALVVGGYNQRDALENKGITESAEIYDPVSNSVAPAAAMSARRQAHAAVLSANGSVAVFGGLGNITTTYLALGDINQTGFNFEAGSQFTADLSGGVAAPTATVTGGTGLVKLDFLLSKPVIGEIADGEMWFSSPAVHADWGTINFTPASPTNSAIGLRLDLAGFSVYCRESSDSVAGNCGSIKTGAPVALSQMQGQATFFPRLALALDGAPTVSAGSLIFSPTPLNSATPTVSLTGGSFTTTVRIPMDNAFIGFTINSGYINRISGTLVQVGSFTVTLSSGGGTIPSTLVGTDSSGNGEAVFSITFNDTLRGTIDFTGSSPQSFPSGQAIPMSGSNMTVSAEGNMVYTMTGANLSGVDLTVDVSTVVIRAMVFADAETYNPQANSWTLAPPPGISASDHRYGHSASLLTDNDMVFIGGRACSGPTCATRVATPSYGFQLLSSEKNFAATGGMAAQARAFHTSTLLPGGDILVAGGTNGPSILNSAEVFSPATNAFTPVNGNLNYVRDLHTATLLPNGRVLVAGGFTTNAASTGSTNTAEIYYPDTRRFIETAPMISSRSNHGAIMLPDGRVFVAGGFGSGDIITGSAEIFISTLSRWIPAAPMPAGCERAIHATVQLKDGRILLIGGINSSGILATLASYDPLANSWGGNCTALAAMPTPLRSHTATLLFDGRVLVAGGNDGLGEANKAFIYDPGANSWTPTDAQPLLEARFNHTATLLPNGTVMISGGSQRFGNVPKSIEVFHINASSWVTGGVQFAGGARAFHTMTLALNNKMYGIGGSDGVIGGNGVSLHLDAEAGYFTATPDLFSKNAPPSIRQAAISGTSASPFLPNTSLTVDGLRFRGGTEASGGAAASAHSSFNVPHLILQQVDGSGGAASQSNGGFVVDLTTQIFLNPANQGTLDTSLTVALPATSAGLPYGWYTLRTGANGIYSDAAMVQVGPPKPVAAPAGIVGAVQGTSSITWTWDALAGADGYNVYDAATNIFLSTIAPSGSPSFNQRALAAGIPVSILVAAYTLTGDGPLTASPTFYTLPNPAAVTQPLVNGRTTSSIDWGWTDPGGVTNFRIYNATTSALLGTSVQPGFTEVGLGTNTQHAIRVSAVVGGEEGPLSPSASGYTAAATPGAFSPAITGLTTGSFVLNWAPNGNPPGTNYAVLAIQYANDDTVFAAATATVTATSQGFGGFSPVTRVGYAISAVNGDGISTALTAATVGSTWTLPNPPYPLNVLGTSPTSIAVGWDFNSNSSSTSYQVTYSRDNFTLNISTAVGFGANFRGSNLTITGLITSATYSVRAIASNPFGQLSQFSNTATTMTFNGGAPVGSIQGPLLSASDTVLNGTLGDGRSVQLRAAANTFPSDVTITISSFQPTGALCPDATNLAFSISCDPALQPTGSVYFTFGYTTGDLGAIPASRALLLRYEPVSNTCIPLETTVDPASGRMTARINHFSLFQVGEVPLASSVEFAHLFPNPYRTGRDGYLTVANVPPGARVRIFTLRGEPVLDATANANGLLTWSGTNGFGRAVASGVYLVMIESGRTKKILKLAVIR